jgi:hypothetical protein
MITGYHIAAITPSAPTRATPRARWGIGVARSLALGNGMATGNPLPCGVFDKRSGNGRSPGSAEGVDV